MSPRHTGPHGALKAAALFPSAVREALAEYKRLNTRAARAAFADRWVGIWSKDFDAAWPMLYELLKIIEEDKLYADPRRVGPDAPGGREAHGEKSRYETFDQYFNDRVRQPFERWAELEQTYHYVHEYAPGLFSKSFGKARAVYLAEMPGLENNGGDRRSEQFQSDNSRLKESGYGTTETYIYRRLKRDRPDLAALVLEGKESARAAGIAAGFIKPTITVPLDPERLAATLRRRLTPAALDRLRELLG